MRNGEDNNQWPGSSWRVGNKCLFHKCLFDRWYKWIWLEHKDETLIWRLNNVQTTAECLMDKQQWANGHGTNISHTWHAAGQGHWKWFAVQASIGMRELMVCQLKTDNRGSSRSYGSRKEAKWARTICQESNSSLGVQEYKTRSILGYSIAVVVLDIATMKHRRTKQCPSWDDRNLNDNDLQSKTPLVRLHVWAHQWNLDSVSSQTFEGTIRFMTRNKVLDGQMFVRWQVTSDPVMWMTTWTIWTILIVIWYKQWLWILRRSWMRNWGGEEVRKRLVECDCQILHVTGIPR